LLSAGFATNSAAKIRRPTPQQFFFQRSLSPQCCGARALPWKLQAQRDLEQSMSDFQQQEEREAAEEEKKRLANTAKMVDDYKARSSEEAGGGRSSPAPRGRPERTRTLSWPGSTSANAPLSAHLVDNGSLEDTADGVAGSAYANAHAYAPTLAVCSAIAIML